MKTFNVKDYGAAGDGQTNDSRPIQNMMDAAIREGGGDMNFNGGTYLISRTIRIGGGSRLTVRNANWILKRP